MTRTPLLLPDFGASIGFRLGGTVGAQRQTAHQAALAASILMDVFVVGLSAASLNYLEAGLPIFFTVPLVPVLLAAVVIRPLVVALAAAVAEGHRDIPSWRALGAGLLYDLLGGALTFLSMALPVASGLPIALGGIALRNGVSPWAVAHLTPRRPPPSPAELGR